MSLFGKKTYTLDRSVRLILKLLLIIVVVYVLNILAEVLVPFALALGLAYMINPLVLKIEKKVQRRGPAVFISLGLVVSLLFALFWLAWPRFATEAHHLFNLLKQMSEQSDLAQRAAERLPPDLWETCRKWLVKPEVKQWVQSEQGILWLKAMGSKLVPSFFGAVKVTSTILTIIIGIMVIVLYLIFILLDYRLIVDGVEKAIPKEYRNSANEFFREFDQTLSRYFRAQTWIAFLVGVSFAIGFTCMGLPMPWILGLMLGLLNLVPYMQMLGLFPVAFLSLTYALERNESFWWVGSWAVMVFVVVQLIQDLILVPRIMGKFSGLSPAIILLALSVWGKLLGLLGLILAIPITCLCWVWYRRWLEREDETVALEK